MSKRKRTQQDVRHGASAPESTPTEVTQGSRKARAVPVQGYRAVKRIECDDGVYYGVADDDCPTRFRALPERDWEAFLRVVRDMSVFITVDADLAFASRVREFGAGVRVIELDETNGGETV